MAALSFQYFGMSFFPSSLKFDLHLLNGRWSHMAGDTPYLWDWYAWRTVDIFSHPGSTK